VKVAYFSLDDPRCAVARLRVLDPFDVLRPQIHLIPVVTFSESSLVIDTAAVHAADLIVVQRGFPRKETQDLLEAVLTLKKPVIYETDDDLRIVPEWHNKPFYSESCPYIEEFARRVDLVTVATDFLADRFRILNANVIVLPNFLRHSLWKEVGQQPERRTELTIGYYGNRGHWKDLEMIEDALYELNNRHPHVRFAFLGCITERLRQMPCASYSEFHDVYSSWPRRLAEGQFDIAVAPLIDCDFNNCRSHIKFLELGMLRIPAVFSNAAPYRDSVEHGSSGLLVSNRASDWLDALELLVIDKDLRARIAENAYTAVTTHHLLEENSHRWLDAYSQIR